MQSQSSNLGGAQSPSTPDCSDPLLASALECSGPTQSGQTQFGQTQAGTTQLPSSQQPGEYGAQPGNFNSGYSDIEQLTRQAGARNEAQQAPLPPEPPTEFQRFVTSTTGQNLPIYGASLFSRVPSTFAPLDMTPVPPDYVIGPGDELRIRAWGQVNFETNVRVDRLGEIFLPQVGPVHVAGMPFSALDAHLRGAVGRVYHNFDLTADVGQIRAVQVYVSGAARRPGVYTVSSLSTLVDALFASGGPSVQGSMRRIQLRRGSAVETEFDLYDLLIHGDKSKDVKLQSGDVIFIPPVGPQAAVVGSVRNFAIYELRADESLAGLLADAGGVSSVASEARVSIERIDDHRDRHAMEVAYDPGGLATPLADGDLVRVYSIVPLYRKTVILRGNTANPGRFAWHAGMRISELIPDKESLITRNYWWKRAQLGLPAPEELTGPSPPGTQQNQPGMQQNQPGTQQSQLGMQESQTLSAQQRSGSTALAAAQTSSSARVPAPAQRTEVRALAPEIDWDYAVIERLDAENLKNVVIPFDLGKLVLQHDASQDLELQAGDVVTIFSEADVRVPIAHQTKMVKLDGEFVHAGMYTAQPGETLRELVERAGGLTPNAYLYGSEFTRETTRALQQARIDEYVQTLSMQMQRSSLAMAVSAPSATPSPTGGAVVQSGIQDMLASLRQIRATGRIVLRFTPDSSGTNSLPNVSLEDGDRFAVPSVPATVNVVGAVYDQNSFLYAQGRRAGTYLRLAGGPDRDADRSHEFIIRADGEVASRERGNTIWSGGEFDNLRINPGDTIVVPQKTVKPSALRSVIDWSQMFSQFALGAAALSILK
jgi:protein involved in polysaccharide export with SLBB domain